MHNTFFSAFRVLSRLSIFYAHTRCRRDRPLSPLSRAGREIVRRVPQIVHAAAEKFQRAASPVFAILPGALTCALCVIVRSRFAECFLPDHRRTESSMLRAVVRRGFASRNSREAAFTEGTSGSCRAFLSRFAHCSYVGRVPLMPPVAAVHTHYPIIVAMAKVSRGNRARGTTCRYAFASGNLGARKFSKHHYVRDSVTNVRPRAC